MEEKGRETEGGSERKRWDERAVVEKRIGRVIQFILERQFRQMEKKKS